MLILNILVYHYINMSKQDILNIENAPFEKPPYVRQYMAISIEKFKTSANFFMKKFENIKWAQGNSRSPL